MKNKIQISENELKTMISESIKKKLVEDDEPFDPYNYKFVGMSDEDFDSFYDDADEAEMQRALIDLMSDGEDIFKQMKEVIENSNFYLKNTDNEIIKKYLSKIDNITDMINNFWD